MTWQLPPPPCTHRSSSSALCFCASRFSLNLRRSSSARARSSGVPASGSHTHVCRPTCPFRLRSSGCPSPSQAVRKRHMAARGWAATATACGRGKAVGVSSKRRRRRRQLGSCVNLQQRSAQRGLHRPSHQSTTAGSAASSLRSGGQRTCPVFCCLGGCGSCNRNWQYTRSRCARQQLPGLRKQCPLQLQTPVGLPGACKTVPGRDG